MTTEPRSRRVAARTMTATVATGAALALLAPSVASASDVEGYSDDVQRAAVQSLTESEGISAPAAQRILRAQDDNIATLDQLAAQLGDREVAGYLDAAGEPVVTVLDTAAAAAAERAGADARVVERSAAELETARTELAAAPAVTHTAIGTDPKANQVVLTIASDAFAAPDAGAQRLLATAQRLGDVVRVEQVDGAMRKAIYNGEAIRGGGTRCSAGFNTNSGGQNYIVDAGHCTEAVSQWDVGPSIDASFPTNDYGLIRNDTGSAPGAVTLWNGSTQPIESAGTARVGQQICKSGSTTYLTCGTVQATGVTVNYQQGPVYDMIQTSADVGPGDSGGCLFDGSTGLGITSGMGGGSSFFQPVTEALRAYGVSLN